MFDSRPAVPAVSFLGRLIQDRRGIIGVEYALLLPLMVSALMGAAETFWAVQAYGKAVSAAQTVADLTARSDTQSTTNMAAIATAAQRVMDPLPSGTNAMGIHVASVGFNNAGTAVTQWSYVWGTGALAVPLTVAANLGRPGESVVMVSFAYAHTPLMHDFFGSLTFRETAVARPRITRNIPFTG